MAALPRFCQRISRRFTANAPTPDGGDDAWARRSGATALKLAVIPGNDPAVAVYARNGFVLTADGVTREQVMAKTLR
ncbi:hypothetical protein [Streptomyces niveus]|uniref:hypothetical protein n=1 Tax=Streptomyces niveus TaxID=193462 RepID=UPI003CFFC8E6